MSHPLRFRSLALGVVVGLVALVQVVAYFRTSPAIPESNLDFRVDRQSSGILVSWNHGATALSAATSAVLTISDEQHTRVLNLSSRDLRETDIFYPSQSSDMKVELQVHGERGGFSQYVRVAGGRVAITSVTSPVVEEQPPAPAPVAKIEAPPAVPLKRNYVREAPRFQAPLAEQKLGPRTVAALEPPPFTPVLPSVLPTGLPTPELPSGVPEAQPRPGRFVPAQALRQIQPSIRATAFGVPVDTALSQTSRMYVLEVRVNLDARGKVRGVKLEHTTGPYSAQLWEAVIDAAARTPFAPATMDGQPVASTQTVRFEIKPQH